MEYIPVAIAVLAAFWATFMTLRAEVRRAEVANRIDVQDDKINRLHGKVGAEERWAREEVREAVDHYLERLDIQPQGASELEAMMQLAHMMQLQKPQHETENPPDDTARGGGRAVPGLIGRGGLEDGLEHNGG